MAKSIFSRENTALLKVLRDLRVAADLTQTEIAGRLKMTQSAYSKLERGELRIDVVQLRQICQVIGIPLREFIVRFEKELARGSKAGRRAAKRKRKN